MLCLLSQTRTQSQHGHLWVILVDTLRYGAKNAGRQLERMCENEKQPFCRLHRTGKCRKMLLKNAKLSPCTLDLQISKARSKHFFCFSKTLECFLQSTCMYLSAVEGIGAERIEKTKGPNGRGPMTCAQAAPAEIAKDILDHGKRRPRKCNTHTDPDRRTDRQRDKQTDR